MDYKITEDKKTGKFHPKGEFWSGGCDGIYPIWKNLTTKSLKKFLGFSFMGNVDVSFGTLKEAQEFIKAYEIKKEEDKRYKDHSI